MYKNYQKQIKDTHSEKSPSNKTPALTKSMNMDIWVVGISNQLFLRGFSAETKFSKKNRVFTGKNPFIGLFFTHHSIFLNIGY